MKLQDLFAGIEILDSNVQGNPEISAVRYSSREVQQGDLFVAVVGYVTDGHKYIPDAIARGASVILCEKETPEDTPWIRVASTRKALAQLGANWYGHPAQSMKMVGVTGTNGKTSVTYLLKSMLETAGAKVGLIGTICNLIGEEELPTERTTPESFELQGILAQMRDKGCTHVVMEVSSHALYLDRTATIPFTVGAFTNLTEDHLDFHGTMECYRQAKSLLFSQCEHGVFNLADPVTPKMIEEAKCTCYTFGDGGDLWAENVILESDHVEMDVREGELCGKLRIGIPGRFTVSNGLMALAIARKLGMDFHQAIKALSQSKGVKGRIEVVPTPGKDYTVLIDYAHTPDGLENVLRSVKDFCKGRVILVFGCGGDRDRKKRPMMGEIAVKYADISIVTSDNPRTEVPVAIIEDILEGMKHSPDAYIVEENRRKAIALALRLGQKNDMIILAGKGHETYQIIGTEKTHLDEREEVAAALWG
ncbi:MAG: UDP-N-acetylmuramoyl-L-alanyl-D-glutamate--2,6-diaminopimelate ligase [Oscillospiraceae bacterium]|nr:UDP-N-acetylmuramoyl-L-alanyl-D-glutamate--2,6-diaminopimelate ligase [Oscillospiraceae bacterium]